ncbi:MAG: hypothetical protein IPG47_10195 [Thermoflexaceae bacterium]|nr:hypothetical protein [Thermoflexaceae bacterium]
MRLFSLGWTMMSNPPRDSSFRKMAEKFVTIVAIITSENMIRPIATIVMPVRKRAVSG